jgi:hypothetical protein
VVSKRPLQLRRGPGLNLARPASSTFSRSAAVETSMPPEPPPPRESLVALPGGQARLWHDRVAAELFFPNCR